MDKPNNLLTGMNPDNDNASIIFNIILEVTYKYVLYIASFSNNVRT